MQTKYEAVVILEATRADEAQKATLDKIEEVITANGGKVDNRDVWGKKRLAYPINKRRDGYYAVITFDTDTQNRVLPELNRHLRIGEEILRFLVSRAVVGKSKGTPLTPEQMARQMMPREREGRGGRRGDDRGGYTPRQAPVAVEAVAEAAPAVDAPAVGVTES